MKELYNDRYFWKSRMFQRKASRIKELKEAVKEHQLGKVLDVGCGIGALVLSLREEGVEATGVDFAECLMEKWWKWPYYIIGDAKELPFKDNEFDTIVSTDFFEHIDEEDIDQVYSEMKRVGGKVLARIAYEKDLKPYQKNWHVTNEPKEWWENRLKGIILI